MLAITEDAVEQLVTTLGRHRSSHGTAADRAACWLRLVSITEIYAETLLGHLDGANPRRVPGGWDDMRSPMASDVSRPSSSRGTVRHRDRCPGRCARSAWPSGTPRP
jgi:hypothetical protein